MVDNIPINTIKMRCDGCGRVCAFIEDDGRCGSPKCRQEEIEEQLDQISLENRDLDIRLTKIEKEVLQEFADNRE